MTGKPDLKILYNSVRQVLWKEYPGSARKLCALKFDSSFQLLTATILSAQCTDDRVNMVTPILFKRFGTPNKMSEAKISDIEEIIKSTGFYHAKAENILKMSRMLVREFNSEVPSSLDDLTTLPGVGRKTANVVLSVWFDKPGLPVDTHVLRVSNRIGLISSKDPVKVEYELNELVLPRDRGAFSIKTILHGRQVCIARKPRCGECKMKDFCLKRGVNGI